MSENTLPADSEALKSALKECEERFSTFVEHSPDLITQVDSEGKFTYVNHAVKTFYGLEPEDCIGKSAFHFVHPDDRERTGASFAQWINEQISSASFENRQVSQTGEVFHMLWTIHPNYDDKGNVLFINSIARDITERKRMEEENRRLMANLETIAEERTKELDRILNNVNDAIISTDMEGTILSWNPAATHMYGWAAEEAIGKPISILYREEDMAMLTDKIVQPTIENGMQEGEYPFVCQDGTERIQRLSTSLIRDEEGNPVSMVGISRDITEQKEAENILRESQQLFQTFLDNFPAFVFAKDAEGRVILSNKLLEDAYGMSRDELHGKTVYDLIPKDMADAIWADEKNVLDTGIPTEVEQVTMEADEERVKLSTTFPLSDEGGQIYGIGAIVIDITERKQMEEERVRLQQEVINAQKQTLKELSTPIIPVIEGIIVMPLIGSIDTQRAREITRALLAGVSEYRAKTVIVDITGVSMVDSGVADHLNKTIQAARLKGAQTIVTGISDAIAETIVDLGIDWSDMDTLRDLQSGLVSALENLGIVMVRQNNKEVWS